MSSFLDAINSWVSEVSSMTPATSPSKAKGAYVSKILQYRDEVIRRCEAGENVNSAIASIVKVNNLNPEQTKRVIEEVNQELYIIKYNKVKDQEVRDVKFELADYNKVMPNSSNQANISKVSEEKGCDNMEKKASIFDDKYEDVKLDCFNYTPYETSMLDLDGDRKKTEKDFKIEKIAKEINKLDENIEKTASTLCQLYSDLAKEYVNIGRYEGVENIQPKFDTMCKKASFDTGKQQALIDMFNMKVDNFKELGYISKIAEYKIEKVEDYKDGYKEYNLGKYSFSKQASDSKLEKLAYEIKNYQDNLEEIQKTRNSLSLDNIEN